MLDPLRSLTSCQSQTHAAAAAALHRPAVAARHQLLLLPRSLLQQQALLLEPQVAQAGSPAANHCG
jgi:hypothetical protein